MSIAQTIVYRAVWLQASKPQYRINVCHVMCDSLQTQFGSSPVSPLKAVSDFITSFHPNPLGSGMILLPFLGQESLNTEDMARSSQLYTPPWQSKAKHIFNTPSLLNLLALPNRP